MDIQDIPPEILATAFEIGTLSWGIKFLPSVCLVCRDWNLVVATTPRLWGIVSISKASPTEPLHSQITKAKASPLTVYISPNALKSSAAVTHAITRVVNLSHNWASADVSTSVLLRCRWSDMHRTLEELVLQKPHPSPNTFFGDNPTPLPQHPRLHTLTANGVNDEWIKPLLSPSIRFFKYISVTGAVALNHTLDQLARIPRVRTLHLERLHHIPRLLPEKRIVPLGELRTLELVVVVYPALLLSSISATSLQTLVIEHVPSFSWRQTTTNPNVDVDFLRLAPLFSQWCQPQFLPSQLHTLKLVDCLDINDIPFLIRFLARLSNLVQLILIDDTINQCADFIRTREHNIFMALASSEGASCAGGGWLCPSLMVLHVEADFDIQDLVQIAVHRGVRSDTTSSMPKSMRTVKGFLCGSGEAELTQLGALVENTECSCLGCSLGAMIV